MGKFTKQSQMHPSGRRKTPSKYVPGKDRTVGFYGRYDRVSESESKFFDGSKAVITVTTGGLILDDSINEIVQGTSEKERIGRKCVINQIAIRGRVRLPAQTDELQADETIRLIVYQDKQTNGAAATVTQILESAAWNSFNNLANSQRFRILHTEWFDLNSQAGGGPVGTDTSQSYAKYFEFYKKCNIPLEFDSTAGAITELRSNNVGILAIGFRGNAQIEYRWRVRFTG